MWPNRSPESPPGHACSLREVVLVFLPWSKQYTFKHICERKCDAIRRAEGAAEQVSLTSQLCPLWRDVFAFLFHPHRKPARVGIKTEEKFHGGISCWVTGRSLLEQPWNEGECWGHGQETERSEEIMNRHGCGYFYKILLSFLHHRTRSAPLFSSGKEDISLHGLRRISPQALGHPEPTFNIFIFRLTSESHNPQGSQLQWSFAF